MAVSYNATQYGTSKQIRWSWSSDSTVIAWAVAVDGTVVDTGTNSSGASGTESVSSWGWHTVTFNIGGTTYTKTVNVEEPEPPPPSTVSCEVWYSTDGDPADADNYVGTRSNLTVGSSYAPNTAALWPATPAGFQQDSVWYLYNGSFYDATNGMTIPGGNFTLAYVFVPLPAGAYIFDGTSWGKPTPHVFDGTTWTQLESDVYDGSSWQS